MQPSAIMTVNDVRDMIGKTLTVRAYVKALCVPVQVAILDVRQRFGRVDYLITCERPEVATKESGRWVEASALEVLG